MAAAVAGLLLAACAQAATQETWPSRPVHLVVPGGAGGVIDVRARWLAQRLTPALGQPVIVENRTGAGGNLGMETAARSVPDGYTLVVIHQGVMTVNPHLFAHPGYDALADFAPVTSLGVSPLLLAVNSDTPVKSVRQLVDLARASPGKLSFGSPGIGTPPHLAGELFKRATGIDVIHVPYKGGGQAASDLIAGHITFTIDGPIVQLQPVLAGRLRALAVTGPSRLALLPDVPTMAEAGWPDFVFVSWVGIAAPAGTPPAIVDRLYREITAIYATPEAREWFATFGAEPGADPPDVFAAAIRAEHAKWGKALREMGLRPE